MTIQAWQEIERLPVHQREAVNRELTVQNRKRPFVRYSYNELHQHYIFIREYGNGFTSDQLARVLSRFTEGEKDVLYIMLNGKAGAELKKRVLSENQYCRRSVAAAIQKVGVSVDAG